MPLLLLAGYGPGNAHSIAARFGGQGWTIALVGRSEERLSAGVELLAAQGVVARAFVGDVSDVDSVPAVAAAVRSELGPVSALALTAYRNVEVSDVLTDPPELIERVFSIGVGGLAALVQASVDDLRSASDAAVLVVNGGLGVSGEEIDRGAVSFGGDGVALECAAKSKLVGLLAERLRGDDVYVGEIVITRAVKGSPYAGPDAIDPADVAERLWTMFRERTSVRTFA